METRTDPARDKGRSSWIQIRRFEVQSRRVNLNMRRNSRSRDDEPNPFTSCLSFPDRRVSVYTGSLPDDPNNPELLS